MIDAIPQTREYPHRRRAPRRRARRGEWSRMCFATTSFRSRKARRARKSRSTSEDCSIARWERRTRERCSSRRRCSRCCARERARSGSSPGWWCSDFWPERRRRSSATILAHLPIFSLAINARMISFAAFGICVLAAIGLQVSIDRARAAGVVLPRRRRGDRGAHRRSSQLQSTLTPDFVRANAIREIVPLLLAFALLRAFRDAPRAAAGLLGLLLLQRVMEIGGFIPAVDRRAFFPPIAGFEHLPRERRAVSHRRPGSALRAEHRRALRTRRCARLSGDDVRAAGGDVSALVDPAAGLVESRRRSHRADAVDDERPLRAGAARIRAIPPSWRLIGRYPGYQLLENSRVLPRAFVPRVVHTGMNDVIRDMRACSDFGAEAWIEMPGRRWSRERRRDRCACALSARACCCTRRCSRPDGSSSPKRRGRDGARRSGGDPLKLHFADRAFLGMYVPAGEHDIVLSYRPKAVTTGAVVSLAGVVVLGVVAIARRRRSDLSSRAAGGTKPRSGGDAEGRRRNSRLQNLH